MKFKSSVIFMSICAALALFQACKKDIATVDFHYAYYDLTPGRFVVYDVVEIKHDQGATIKHDTLVYQLKSVIGDTVIDNAGRIARKFFRYKRANSTQNWVFSDVWTTIIVDNRAELVEENQRIVKLVFAPTLSKSWDINAFNSFSKLEAYYRDLHKPTLVNGLTFDSSLVVEQDDFLSLVDYRRKFEVYAKGVGLVRKYSKDLNIQNFDTINGVLNGKELFYQIRSFGVE